jgi:MFS family permease
VSVIALPLLAIVTLHASALEVALILGFQYLADLALGLLIGVHVDRKDRWRIMIASDAGRAVLTLLVPLLAWVHLLAMWQVYVIGTLVGVLRVYFDTASQAYLTEIVPDKLMPANTRLQTASSAAGLAQTAGGGLVQWLGAPLALVADSVSYVVSLICVATTRVKVTSEPVKHGPQQSVVAEAKEGLQFVRDHWLLRRMIGFVAHSNIVVGGQNAIMFVFLARTVGAGPALIGVLAVVDGIGALMGGAWVGRLTNKLRPGRVIVLATLAVPFFNFLVPFAKLWWLPLTLFVIGVLVTNASARGVSIILRTCRQLIVPDDLMGRVGATVQLFSRGSLPIGALLGGLFAEVWGLRGGMIALAILMAFIPLWVTSRRVWRLTFDSLRTTSS